MTEDTCFRQPHNQQSSGDTEKTPEEEWDLVKMDSMVSSRQDEKCHMCFYFTPQWAQRLASRNSFAVSYGILTIVQGMSFMYTVSTFTSIENHFQLRSEILGAIISAAEFATFFSGIIIGIVVGPKTHRPFALAICLVILGIGTLLMSLPYSVFGNPIPLKDAVNGSSTYSLCHKQRNSSSQECVSSLLAPPNTTTWTVALLFLMAHAMANGGGSSMHIIGTTFIDDNVQSKDSPLYLACLCCTRTIGPMFGALLSSVVLKVYVNPQVTPWFDDLDSRWVGAWWLGYLVISFLCFVCAFMIAQFPKRLPSKIITPAIQMEMKEMKAKKEGESVEIENKSKLKGFKEKLNNGRRVLGNKLLWLRIFSEIGAWFAVEGFMIYLPKYLENEFHISASDANLWTGCAFLVPTVVGELIIGFVVRRFQPSTSHLAAILTAAKILHSITMATLAGLGCSDSTILTDESSSSFCWSGNCNCTIAIFSPVCGGDGQSYYSACYAGCTTSSIEAKKTIFTNCACIQGGMASDSICQLNCPQKYAYLSLVALSKIFFSVTIVAGVLFVLRCVEPRDKTAASGFFGAIFGILTFVPCPLVFSAAVDGSCSIWSEQCGSRGACNVYDMDKFRLLLHLMPCALLAISACFDFCFWWMAKTRMDLFQDEIENGDHSNEHVENEKRVDL